ncbi:PREDICTED: uncharacterized protein LOC105451239 [Wasmannia auropunctata]|uniref:uncharacterized protein LOC105451239 n=1 Tax=Wasmannia auropunctata TaxID=64793 RepID=UPI0005EE8EDD|nr:PREDICTED: uncharacterized protein LOC105451239 [Wasmannia auropunctata]
MSPRDLALRVLLISIVRFSTTSIIRPQRLYIVQLSSQPARGNIPDRWRTLPEFDAPQIEIQLLKGYVSSNGKLIFTNEYKYPETGYNGEAKMTSTTDEKKIWQIENDDMKERGKEKENVQGNIVIPGRTIPAIGSRHVIDAPPRCPDGKKHDAHGQCREMI